MFEKFPNLFKFPKSFTQFWKSPIFRRLRGIVDGASGTTFTTSGIDNGPWSYKTGAEIAQELQDNLSVSVAYDLDGKGSDFKNHSVSAKVNWKF